MGCLFFPLELLVDGILDGWFALMQWIVPERCASRAFRIAIKIFALIMSCLLFLVMFMGVFAVISADPYTRLIGKYMIFVPLGISALQIAVGVIVRVASKKKK